MGQSAPTDCVTAHDPVTIGTRAPDFAVSGSDGSDVSLSALQGTPVLLAFFPEAWDPSRMHILESYKAMLRDFPGAGQVVSVSRDEHRYELETDDGAQHRFALLSGLDRRDDVAARYGVSGQSALFLVDVEGIVRWKHVARGGAQPDMDDLQGALDPSAGTRRVTRRDFLVTTFAVSLVLSIAPRLGHAADVTGVAEVSSQARGGRADPAEQIITLNVNGQPMQVRVEPRVSLLDALRERMGLMGTKKGCDHGQCGACTVHVDNRRVNACLMLAMQAQGTRITTIEGLAAGEALHPMQAAFIKHDGFQCGYCTSGQIMSAVACVSEGHARSREEITEWMSGNICRCGAYPGICAAIEEARASIGGSA